MITANKSTYGPDKSMLIISSHFCNVQKIFLFSRKTKQTDQINWATKNVKTKEIRLNKRQKELCLKNSINTHIQIYSLNNMKNISEQLNI